MSYDIEHYALRWKNAGHRVLVHVGSENIPDADIVMLHVNLSVIPDAYIQALRHHPMVLNGGIQDISRRCFSQLLLEKPDTYSGPVIVKTNANYGGWPELRNEQNAPPPSIPYSETITRRKSPILKRMYSRFLRPRSVDFHHSYPGGPAPAKWQDIQTLNPLAYPVFKKKKHVPKDVWDNDHLIVERFIAHEKDELFHTQYCIFFGDKEIAGQLSARQPIVKFGNAVSDIEVPVPDVVKQWRKELNIDYGRFDYVGDGDMLYLIDVNKTEKGGAMNYQYTKEMDFLASGLTYYLKRL